MLTDGGTDSFKSLAFSNAKDDKFLRFARLGITGVIESGLTRARRSKIMKSGIM